VSSTQNTHCVGDTATRSPSHLPTTTFPLRAPHSPWALDNLLLPHLSMPQAPCPPPLVSAAFGLGGPSGVPPMGSMVETYGTMGSFGSGVASFGCTGTGMALVGTTGGFGGATATNGPTPWQPSPQQQQQQNQQSFGYGFGYDM